MTKRIASLDIGIKYVGVAVTDPMWNFPVVTGTLQRKESIQDDLRRLEEMLKDIEISAFVIGWPLNMSGIEGKMTPVVKGFEKRLKELFPNVLFFHQDESQSSDEAVEIKNITPRNYRKNKKSGVIDRTAAAVILQRFMETKEFKELKEKTAIF